MGLRWNDVDLDGGVLRVRRCVQRHTWVHGGAVLEDLPSCSHKRGAECERRTNGGLVLVEPKTKASKRSMSSHGPWSRSCAPHRACVNRRRLAAGEAWDSTHDLVFPDMHGGLVDPARDNAEWHRLIGAAGVRDVRLHDARHTAATLLLLQNVDIRTVMSIMGWTEMATAQRYTHAVDELRRRAADQMGSLLWDEAGWPLAGGTRLRGPGAQDRVGLDTFRNCQRSLRCSCHSYSAKPPLGCLAANTSRLGP